MSKHQPTVFNQLFCLVRDHLYPFIGQLNKYSKKFNCESLLKILLYAQIAKKISLRDIETWLNANDEKLYHMWIKSTARSTIADRNKKVDNSMFENLFYTLFRKYKSSFVWRNIGIENKCIALDSSLISLALWLYDRAKYRTSKWWIRIHIWLEIDNCLPRFCVVKDWKKADNIVASEIINTWYLKKDEIMVFDRYYVDFKLWRKIDDNWSFFVTRTKVNTNYIIVEEKKIDNPQIQLDANIELVSDLIKEKYWKELRVIRYYDKESERLFEYITNNFDLTATQIAMIYKYRREIEKFFRWIKQNLKIKSFLWTSENAVKNQIRVAMIYYLITMYLATVSKLWKQQILKLVRLLEEKCMVWIWLVELFAMCRSKTSSCLSAPLHPPNSLFSV
jgi:hypothetical protein